MLIKPPIPDLLWFITNSHNIENIPISYQDVEATMNKKKKNNYAHGHLLSFFYSMDKLLNSNDYPARIEPKFIRDSELSLFWLKKLYSLCMSPLIEERDLNYSNLKIEGYRSDLSSNFLISAPVPFYIPNYMHLWLKELYNIHEKIKNKIDSPYGLTESQSKEIKLFVDEIPVYFSIIQPFQYQNNRFGRLIQQIVRLGWNMPIQKEINYTKFKTDLELFQRNKFESLKEKALKLN